MKHRIGIALLLCGALAACSASSTDRLVDRLNNFNRGVEAVDATIANVSSKLYARCGEMQAVAQAADDITGQCTKASPVVTVGNNVIRTFCQKPPENIAGAIQSVATSVSTSKSALAEAKKQCAVAGG